MEKVEIQVFDDQGEEWGESIEVSTQEEAEKHMADLVEMDFPPEQKTFWVDVVARITGTDDDYAWNTVTVHPEEPGCEVEEHDWQSPHEVVGGLEENPGVRGSGGGVIITEVCRHCGTYRIKDTWAQRPDTGEQGLTSYEYKDADADSLGWISEDEG